MTYRIDVLVQGFPGRAVCHGGLGWSTVTLLRGVGRTILVDVGSFGMRREIAAQLQVLGVRAADVTDVVLTHAHYDHSVNFTLFPEATVWIGREELGWASVQPPGFDPLPELYVRELALSARVRQVEAGEAFLPGIEAVAAPGHTPGHLLFLLTNGTSRVLFTGDAAKNRAELLARRPEQMEDPATACASIERIWSLWRQGETLLVPGHDIAMRLDDKGMPLYTGPRRAGISAWLDTSLDVVTRFDLDRSASGGS